MALPPIAVTEVALGGISRYYNISAGSTMRCLTTHDKWHRFWCNDLFYDAWEHGVLHKGANCSKIRHFCMKGTKN